MKVECVEEGLCKRHLDIEIPPQSVTKAFDDEVEQYRRTVKLKGFRKGKLPKELVRTRFRAEILNQVVQEILPKALQQALNEQGLSPIGEPELSNLEVDVDQPLKFRASIEIMPQIEVEKWKGLEAVEQKTEVSDEEIEKRLESLQERAARFDPVEDRGARDGDFIIGSILEQPEGGGPESRQDGALIEVGTSVYHPTLHEKLQGAKSGDKLSFRVTFPADHPDKDKADKTYDVTVDVNEIKEKVLPKLDDELAKDLGEFETLEELKKQVRDQAEAEARINDEQHLRSQLLEKLIQANAFEAPPSLVEHEMDRRVEELARSFTERGLDPSGSGIDWRDVREKQRESSAQSVKATILMDRLAEQDNLKETEEEVDREVERIASSVKKTTDVVRAQLMKEGGLERIRRHLKRDKAFDLIRENARIQGS